MANKNTKMPVQHRVTLATEEEKKKGSRHGNRPDREGLRKRNDHASG